MNLHATAKAVANLATGSSRPEDLQVVAESVVEGASDPKAFVALKDALEQQGVSELFIFKNFGRPSTAAAFVRAQAEAGQAGIPAPLAQVLLQIAERPVPDVDVRKLRSKLIDFSMEYAKEPELCAVREGFTVALRDPIVFAELMHDMPDGFKMVMGDAPETLVTNMRKRNQRHLDQGTSSPERQKLDDVLARFERKTAAIASLDSD